MSARAPTTLLAAVVFTLGVSCSDPAKDDIIATLGPETSAPGATHRPGQPCAVCHDGSTAKQFSVAGTVYNIQGQTDPAVGAVVEIFDLAGNGLCKATTNSAGNFYLLPTQCTPVAPYKPKVTSSDGMTVAQMTTRVGRDASCATCHKGNAPTAHTVESVYLNVGGP